MTAAPEVRDDVPVVPRYATFHHAYVDQVRTVFRAPTHRNAPRGLPSRERLAVQFELLDPRQRVPLVPARRTNIVFNFAEALWYLAGRDDLDFIAYYAPGLRRYSIDGRSLSGTAYGARIFGPGRSRWSAVVDQLVADPDTKRAVLQVFDGAELLVPGNIDVACTLGLQFLLRDGALHCVAFMRANDAYRGMVSDVFSFTFLQELLATQLGVRTGTYTHIAGSLHVYDADEPAVQRLLADPAAGAGPAFSFPAMPGQDNWPAIREVLEIEEALRANRHQLDPDARPGLPGYWHQVVQLLEVYRRVCRDLPVTAALLGGLEPIHRWLVRARWPDRLSAPEDLP